MLFRPFAAWAVAFSLFCAAPDPAHAFQVSPLVMEMDSVGARARMNFTVVNNSDRPMPVEFDVARFTMDENGQLSESDGSADFLVFPPQAIVAPFGRQTVRLEWLGEPLLAQSQHYYVTSKQLPVQTQPRAGAGTTLSVRLAFNIRALVNVKPPQGAPDLRVASAGIERDAQGVARIYGVIENLSNVHGSIGQSRVRLSARDAAGAEIWSFTPTPGDLGVRVGSGVAPALGRRRYVFPFELPPEIGARAVGASVEISGQRPR